MIIKVTYSSIDRYRQTRSFSTLKGAQAFATRWIGETPEMGSHYAVSGDGVGKISMTWVTFEAAGAETPVRLIDLFPRLVEGEKALREMEARRSRPYYSYEEMQGDPGGDGDDEMPF